MKKLRVYLIPVAVAAASFACSNAASDPGPDEAAPAAEALSGGAGSLTCKTDTARLQDGESNAFASFNLTLDGKTAKITGVVFTTGYVSELQQEVSDEQGFLAKGVFSDGTPLTAADRAQSIDRISKLNKILAAGTAKTLAFEGNNKPYVRKPKIPTVQFPLVVKTTGIDADTLWDTLGREGNGARLLMRPAMATGAPGKPDIEFEGSQGPVWDRYDCK